MKLLNLAMEITVVIIVFVMSIGLIYGGYIGLKKSQYYTNKLIGFLMCLFGFLLLMVTITLTSLI